MKIRLYILFVFTMLAGSQLILAQTVLPKIEGRTLIANGSSGGPAITGDDRFGVSVDNIGDLNNDGVDDLAVGAHLDDDGGTSTNDYGAVYICFMTTSKTVSSYVKIGKGTSGIGSDISTLNYFGRSVAGIGDLNRDGNEDIVVGAYGTDITSYANSGAVYVIFLNSSAGIVSYKKITRGGNGGPTTILAQSSFGVSVTNLGDVNGDGRNDIGVGGHTHDGPSSGNQNGGFWTLFMNTNGTVASSGFVTKSTGWSVVLANSDLFGFSCAGTGDLNGDGIGDVLVSATQDDEYSVNSGCVYLLYLNSSGTVDTFIKYKQPFIEKVYYNMATSTFGTDLMVEDINEDGLPEFFVGSTNDNAFFILATDTLENLITVKRYDDYTHSVYTFSGAGIGYGLASLGDIDNDGKKEIAIGAFAYDASGYTNNGAVYVVDFTSTDVEIATGNVLEFDKYGNLSNNVIAALDVSDVFGYGVCQVGDVNGDGYNDIAVGAFGDDDGGASRGAAYIIFLDSLQHKDTVVKISSTTGGFGSGLDDGDAFGISMCGPGDLNSDGVPDLVVGAFADDDGGTDRGAIYILYLNTNGTVASKKKISSGTSGFSGTLSNGCRFGFSVAAPGDINNDGVNDLAVGAHLGDDGGADRGEVWILFLDTSENVTGQQKISDTQGGFTASFSANAVDFGICVGAAGDMNGDGKEDIIVGAYEMDTDGAAYVIYLDTLGMATGYKKIGNQNGNFPYSLQAGTGFGRAVQVIEDLDGDGNREIAIGHWQYESNSNERGAIWICFTDSLQNITHAQLISEDTGHFHATISPAVLFGASIATYRDADSVEHIFIGAPNDNENSSNEGSVFRLKLSKPADLLNKVTSFAQLFREPDGGYYKVSDDHKLYFEYRSEYTASELRYNIYDQDHEIVKSNTSTPGLLYSYEQTAYSDDKVWEQNKFFLKLPTLSNGYYLLEIMDEKNDRQYLRFWMPK